MKSLTRFPNDAAFAFTILDDTDDMTVEKGRPIYDLLYRCGLRITKTVWTLDTPPEKQGPYFAGETLASDNYLDWVMDLDSRGFEIGFHNATMASSRREETEAAINFINNTFSKPLRLHCNHGQNLENLYWGPDRYSSVMLRAIYSYMAKRSSQPHYQGDKPGSPYYWADIAAEKLSYMRAFTFKRLDCSKLPPGRVYVDDSKQPRPLLFNTADAPDVYAFNRMVNRKSIDRLVSQRGWTIVSTHLGKGYYRDNRLDPQFVDTIEYLSRESGWFVPASELLDYIGKSLGVDPLTRFERLRMEYSHFADRLGDRLFGKSEY